MADEPVIGVELDSTLESFDSTMNSVSESPDSGDEASQNVQDEISPQFDWAKQHNAESLLEWSKPPVSNREPDSDDESEYCEDSDPLSESDRIPPGHRRKVAFDEIDAPSNKSNTSNTSSGQVKFKKVPWPELMDKIRTYLTYHPDDRKNNPPWPNMSRNKKTEWKKKIKNGGYCLVDGVLMMRRKQSLQGGKIKRGKLHFIQAWLIVVIVLNNFSRFGEKLCQLTLSASLIFCHKSTKYKYYSITERLVKIVLDPQEKENIIYYNHQGAIPNQGSADTLEAQTMSAHVGYNKTRDKIAQSFYWENMCEEIRLFCLTCDRCQRAQNLKMAKTQQKLHPIHVESKVIIFD